MNTSSTALPAHRLSPIPEADQRDSNYHQTSLRLTKQDIMWLDGLAVIYSSSRSAVARLVMAEARQMGEKSVARASAGGGN